MGSTTSSCLTPIIERQNLNGLVVLFTMVSYKSIQRGDTVIISSSKMLNSVNTFFVSSAKNPQVTLIEKAQLEINIFYKKNEEPFLIYAHTKV